MIEEYSGKAKCDIHTPFGRCEHSSTKYIFGITLCDNHHHMLYGMSGNIISKDDNGYDKMAGIIAEKMEENK